MVQKSYLLDDKMINVTVVMWKQLDLIPVEGYHFIFLGALSVSW